MEIDHTNAGYEQSRREQARLHEELEGRERALRETHTSSFDEMDELKRVPELRVDEFFFWVGNHVIVRPRRPELPLERPPKSMRMLCFRRWQSSDTIFATKPETQIDTGRSFALGLPQVSQ